MFHVRIIESNWQGRKWLAYAIVQIMLMILLVLGVLIEGLLFCVPFLWRCRRYVTGVPLALTVFASLALGLMWWNVWGGLLVLTGIFRVINHLRIAEGRMHERYLLKATRRTGVVLAAAQMLLLAGAWYWPADLSWPAWWLVIASMQVVFAAGVLLLTCRNILKSRVRPADRHYSDKELPTLSVAIPARNETADLEACLRSVLANDYPKLEVLVLDDCSQDRTSQVIKSFAHDGVRFIKGKEPEERWLAKNQAYGALADEASGEFIVFCGVDVRFGPATLRALVTTALARQKSMVSVMPRRLTSDPFGSMLQSMRYWWELAPPRRYFRRPPVLSACWMIRRRTLKDLGGLEAVRHAIIPEGYFARELIKTDGYSFIRADDVLDVQTRKGWRDQYETAVRTQYPQIRRRPEVALMLTLVLPFLLGPFVVAVAGFWIELGAAWPLAAVAVICLALTHFMIVRVSDPANAVFALFEFPLAAIGELVLGYISMYKYEFSTVDWKGRNICIPVMHVVPRLPNPDAHAG